MSGFKIDDYKDVAERIAEFAAKYPDGSLQSEIVLRDNGVLCKAYAYRTPDDDRPGIGHAFEPVPGKTPYTRDSEVMNAETSAWGRAIVALGFETKKIASRQEVQARQAFGEEPKPARGATTPKGAAAGSAGRKSGDAAPSSSPDPDPHGLQAGRADSGQFKAPDPSALASDKQRNYVKALIKKLNLTDEQVGTDIGDVHTLTKGRATEVIERLKRLETNRAQQPATEDDIPF